MGVCVLEPWPGLVLKPGGLLPFSTKVHGHFPSWHGSVMTHKVQAGHTTVQRRQTTAALWTQCAEAVKAVGPWSER